MAFRILAGLITSFFISLAAWAEDIQINPSHPNQYTVVKGDTLWDISSKFLTHPWQWPDLWSRNTQVKNPHLIYPGDTLYFSMVNGKPQLSLSRSEQPQPQDTSDSPCILKEEDYKKGRNSFPVSKEGKLLPCIRESSLKQAVKLIPTENIANYLASPKVVDADEISRAPYVVGFAGEHIIVGAGDRVYVRAINEPASLSYTIYRPGNAYISPENGENLGYEAQFIADATLQQPGDPATLAITKSVLEIRTGDRIMPNTEEDIALNFFPRPPEQSIKGNIISVLGGVSQIGRFNVVVIDKGTADGLSVGHELNIYKAGKIVRDAYSPVKNDAVHLPDEIAGTLMVFRPFARVSYALVMNATEALHVLDKVRTP
ncbi:LysM peptidoglycan-binding domain-containing protein [Candidatus Methylobacter oryzae]|uniref:LysM peptidoglycan-binding domain-containing protein n=1 Tax=Candidatus Methylobacter oryzae TaxID=2497749 RepID=A0ABY3C9J4_9GAMM|nr:LysM domain-containing protein [Candidatus Methylobacter oryzae]TRW94248.1 LysM peptidoglycan-binding domain-containing protein [Candidatus Methylobacter oryzae]